VRKNVNFGVVPRDELAVVPDFLGWLQHAAIISTRGSLL